jgi:YD repeat-containing protein
MVNNCFLKGQSGNGTQLQYTYDANGNRLTRTVITVTMVSKTSVTDTLQSKKNVPINSAATDFKINVGPNPTTSLVTVSLQNTDLKQKEEFEYVVTSVTGAQVLTNKVQTSNTDIDLGGLKDGVYILKLMANNKTFIYKIVKAN